MNQASQDTTQENFGGETLPLITAETLREVALSRSEYELIVEKLGRAPNAVELGIFGAMWSEHCGYKNSKPLLRTLPTSSPRVITGAGQENAGAVDIGNNLAVVFKIESHNHPSAVEPYQGAATGVGGIVRDIFTMGARPIALLDSLRFGPLDEPRNRYLFHGVVGGVGGYGNCLGIPTVGGEVYFDAAYSANPLLNAMCVGLVEHDKIMSARASGAGNPVLLVGADTGRDGIHGATFASVVDPTTTRRSAVQVGNPFLEKLLMESCLELAGSDAIIGMQDLGAAGLTSSTVESARKGQSGIDIDVLKVSRRESGMTPYEVMLSESQERMLLVVKKGREAEVQRHFARWGLHSDIIGHVTNVEIVRIWEGNVVVAEIPTRLLTDEVPLYTREGIAPAYLADLWARDLGALPHPANRLTQSNVLLQMLFSANLASREGIYRTYDHMVGTNTLIGPGSDAAVLRVKGTDTALALTTDGNGRYCYLDPYRGGAIAVAEAARNLACTGALPLALTNCLNFGNPERPEIYYQLQQVVAGMSAAAAALGTPVISGNVSLYNETGGQAVYPTPVVGMVGLIERPVGAGLKPALPAAFQQPGDIVALLGVCTDELGASEYLAVVHRLVAGRTPRLDLAREQAVQEVCRLASQAGLLHSAHDCSDGGLAVALAECCIWSGYGMEGADVTVSHQSNGDLVLRDRDGVAAAALEAALVMALLYGEAQSRIIVSLAPEAWEPLQSLATERKAPLARLGIVGGAELTLGSWLAVPVATLTTAWKKGLMEKG